MKTQCSICQNSDKVIIQDGHLGLYRCRRCAHSFKNISKEEQEQFSDEYYLQTHKNWFSNPDYRLFDFIHVKILELAPDRKVRLLDVGCGKGDFLKYLNHTNFKIDLHGVDLTHNQYPGINFIEGDFLKEKIGMRFDVICSLAVIEHIDSPLLFIRKINNLLLPDGLLFIMTVNDDGLIYKIARLFKRMGIDSAYSRLYGHQNLQFFTNRSLRAILKTNGFDVILQKNHNHPLKAVDLPKANFVTTQLYRIFLRIIFPLSAIGKNGLLQIVICKKRHFKRETNSPKMKPPHRRAGGVSFNRPKETPNLRAGGDSS